MDDARGVATAPTAEPSSRTDRLELLQQLPGGTVGAVHKARSPKLNRIVALRQVIVPEWLEDGGDLIKRLLAEVRAASALDHPNITRLYPGGYKGFTVFVISEFVEGQNIKEYATARNLGVPAIIALGKQLCAALDYAHEKNVFHHALNPANLKVLPEGTLKILDFGLLRDKHLCSPSPGKRLESEHYLSPEQLKGKPANQATNVFSAATILYELLTTRNPFAGKHLGEVDRNIAEIDPPPASLAHNRVSEAVSKVLMKGLAKHPLARFQTCAQLAAALEEALRCGPEKAASPVAPAVAPVAAPPASISNHPPASNGQPAAPKPAIGNNLPSQPKPSPSPAPISRPAAGPVRSERAVAVPPAKMPVKMQVQWKLLGAIAAGLFVVLAAAIFLNHRSRVPAASPESTVQLPQTPEATPEPVAVSETSADPAPAIDPGEGPSKVSKRRAVRNAAVPLPAAPTEGQIAISSEPEGATISIEGKTTESWKTPQVVGSLTPAVYKVTVSKPGYTAETRSVQVVSGNRASLDVKLTALRATLVVGGSPPGARIILDGKETGKFSPAEFTLDPAAHTISLRKEGFFDSTETVTLTAGQKLNYSPSLMAAGRTDNIKVVSGGGFKKLFGGGSAGMVRLEIRTEPKGVEVTINGSAQSKTTPMDLQLEPGNYEVILQKQGYKPIKQRFTGEANQKIRIEEQLQPQ